MVYLNYKRVVYAFSLFSGLAIISSAQGINNHSFSHCYAPERLVTFQQRACYYENRLLAPSMLGHALFSSGFEQWRNSPHSKPEDGPEFAHRFESFYARHAAQSAGEFIAGYLNKEDPRYHLSDRHGVWNRTKAALRSVVEVNGENGSRPALAPIAGAFGEGFVGMACYRTHNNLEDGFRRTGISYGGYFGTAVLREFSPDLTLMANRMFRRHKQDLP